MCLNTHSIECEKKIHVLTLIEENKGNKLRALFSIWKKEEEGILHIIFHVNDLAGVIRNYI